jgi:CRP-like cAMP-binding protein
MALSTIERVLFLRGVELFSQIASEDLVYVAQVCQEVYIKSGERFITQGDIGDCLYVLIDGEAKVVLGDEQDLYYRVSKDILGEMAIISRNPRSAHCDAVTEITALRIIHDDFWDLMAEKPALALGVIKVLANRLDETVRDLSHR